MIEIPRAALTADEIAAEADFFCFGTNDLTQMTYGFSRDDAGKFHGIGHCDLFSAERLLCGQVFYEWFQFQSCHGAVLLQRFLHPGNAFCAEHVGEILLLAHRAPHAPPVDDHGGKGEKEHVWNVFEHYFLSSPFQNIR